MIAVRLLPLAASLLLATPASVPSTLGAGPVPSLNPLAELDKATLKAFVEQPLFEPSRHPPAIVPPIVYVVPPPPPPSPPMVEPPPSLRLLGLVEGAHTMAAVVRRNDTGKTETLRPGDRIGSWVVLVMPATLRVSSGDRSFDYSLFRGGAQQGPVPVLSPPPFEAPTVAARDPITGAAR